MEFNSGIDPEKSGGTQHVKVVKQFPLYFGQYSHFQSSSGR